MLYRALLLILALPITSVADDDPGFEPVWISSVTASSTFASPKNAYDPKLTLFPRVTVNAKTGDERYDSAWCEGKPDEGIGEAVTIEFVLPTQIDDVVIKAGVWMTQKLFDANNQITELEISTNDGRKVIAKPTPKREEVKVKLGGAPVTKLVVKIAAVKKGKMNDSCITDIDFNAEASTPFMIGFDKTAAAAFSTAFKEATDAIWNSCDRTKLEKYMAFPFDYVLVENTHSSIERYRFKKHPQRFDTADELSKWCKNTGVSGSPMELAMGKPGQIVMTFHTAEATQRMHFTWRKGQWRVTKID